MVRLISELYPICRSITGDGLRETLRLLQRQIPLELREVPTVHKYLIGTVPKEWNIRDAYVKNAKGERVIDFENRFARGELQCASAAPDAPGGGEGASAHPACLIGLDFLTGRLTTRRAGDFACLRSSSRS